MSKGHKIIIFNSHGGQKEFPIKDSLCKETGWNLYLFQQTQDIQV